MITLKLYPNSSNNNILIGICMAQTKYAVCHFYSTTGGLSCQVLHHPLSVTIEQVALLGYSSCLSIGTKSAANVLPTYSSFLAIFSKHK